VCVCMKEWERERVRESVCVAQRLTVLFLPLIRECACVCETETDGAVLATDTDGTSRRSH